MPTLEATATIIINDGDTYRGEYVIEQDVEIVRSDIATKPDPKWTFTDDQGHFHAFTAEGGLPTLRDEIVDVPCDGSCGGVCDGEGYTIIKHACRICGQEIEPGRIPDPYSEIPGRKSAAVTVRSSVPLDHRGEEVTVRATGPDGREMIGVGIITTIEVAHSFDEVPVCTATIHMRSLEPRLTP